MNFYVLNHTWFVMESVIVSYFQHLESHTFIIQGSCLKWEIVVSSYNLLLCNRICDFVLFFVYYINWFDLNFSSDVTKNTQWRNPMYRVILLLGRSTKGVFPVKSHSLNTQYWSRSRTFIRLYILTCLGVSVPNLDDPFES